MAGDKFNLTVNSWWNSGSTPGTPVSPLTDLLSALTNSIGGITSTHGGATVSELQTGNILNSGATDFLGSQTYNSSRPKAFFNWVLFDEQFKLVASSSGVEQVAGSNVYSTHTRTNLPIDKNGYLYIYVSNETPNIDVFFDNLQITHIRGPVLEETHYYPFGLTMAGISSKALGYGNPQNRYKFNDGTELANQEFSDGSGLELYETPFRGYDPQIGRFWQIDGMADDYASWTPYAFSLNNPIFFNDPSGLASEDPKDPDRAVVTEASFLQNVTVSSTPKNKWNYMDWARFVDLNKHHDFGQLQKYLEKQGVNEQGLTWFNQAIKGIEYRQNLAEIEASWRSFVQSALLEGATWVAGGVVMKVGGKLVTIGYRAYKLNRLRQAEKGAQYLYHYTSEAAAKGISESGLKVGKDGFSYLTNNGNLSPLQAQIELALPANRMLPTSVLKINVTGLDPALVRRVTGNLPGMGAGGGTEFLFNQTIPSNLIQIIK